MSPWLYYGPALLLLGADVAFGRRRLLPYTCAVLVSSLVSETDADARLHFAASMAVPSALVAVLWRLTASRHACVGAALGLTIALAFGLLDGTRPGRGLAFMAGQTIGALAVVFAYAQPARLALTKPRAADASLITFAAFDIGVVMAAFAEHVDFGVRLADVWPTLLWIQGGVFVTLSFVHWKWSART